LGILGSTKANLRVRSRRARRVQEKNYPAAMTDPAAARALADEQRMRALVMGPPAFMRRLRAIEDFEEVILRALRRRDEATPEGPSFPEGSYAKLLSLVAAHNKFYPVEANLPINPKTGEMLDRNGKPWRPRVCPSRGELIARARSRSA
jgi:hypothetical protein